jgi:hypothetical protein
MADKDDTFHDDVLAMADRLGLKGDRRRKYVHEHMTGAGYRMEPTYVPDDDNDDDDDDKDSGFGLGRSRRRGRSSRDDDDDDRGGRSRGRGSKSGGGSDNWYS